MIGILSLDESRNEVVFDHAIRDFGDDNGIFSFVDMCSAIKVEVAVSGLI